MTKKNINISEKLIMSLLIGFFLSLIITSIGHSVQSDWSAMPVSERGSNSRLTGGGISVSMGAKVSSCSYKCLFGSRHRADCKGKNLSNFSETKPKILKATFEHTPLIFIMGLILSTVIYLTQTVQINVTKE